MKITIELNENQDKKVELYKIEHKLNTKAEAIAQMIDTIKLDVTVPKAIHPKQILDNVEGQLRDMFK